jgi:trehalose 6-phosphate synthase
MDEPAGGGRVLVASNRGPISYHLGEDGQLNARRGGGGMVSGLLTVASQAELLWVCAALSEADRKAARAAPGGLLELDGPGGAAGTSAVRMLDIPPDTFDRAYNGIANSTLWFLHHMLYNLPGQPRFGPEFSQDWESFRAYNRAFATALATACAGQRRPPRAVVQDYHLTLVPRMLAELRPGIKIAHFSHTPWAPPEYYRVLPDAVAREVLEGILGADHAGFLCQRWADAFADCCAAVLGAEVDRERGQVRYRGHVTGIGVHALGVDAAALRGRAAEPDVAAQAAELAQLAGGRKLIVRIDRTELSKNILRGLAACWSRGRSGGGGSCTWPSPTPRAPTWPSTGSTPRRSRRWRRRLRPSSRPTTGPRWSSRPTTTTPGPWPATGSPTSCWSTRSGTA